MKSLVFMVLMLVCLSTQAQLFGESSKQTYSSPQLKSEIVKHKKVAILPFKSSISFKRQPKNYDAEAIKAEEKNLAINLQNGMYTYLLRKANSYTVAFQDVDRTNALLKQANAYDNLDAITNDSLCKILDVDAVIKCNYAYEKTGSEGGAIVKSVLLGVSAKTGSGSLTMQLYNKKDGELLWRFYKEMNETITSNANEVMERMMRKVSRNFPYED
jgi:hypothetical protein